MRTINQTGSRHGRRALAAALATATMLLASCATTGGYEEYGIAPIPDGKGRLFLEAGGIPQLNFYVLDAATGEEVYADAPLQSAYSPSAFEYGMPETNLLVDLDPGVYKVVVNTHISDSYVIPEVEIRRGEEAHPMVRVGRFQVIYNSEFGARVPFLIMDYNMRNTLGRAMTSPDVRHFIVPEGHYKIRIENSAQGIDEQRPVEVGFGRITPIQIGETRAEEPADAEEE